MEETHSVSRGRAAPARLRSGRFRALAPDENLTNTPPAYGKQQFGKRDRKRRALFPLGATRPSASAALALLALTARARVRMPVGVEMARGATPNWRRCSTCFVLALVRHPLRRSSSWNGS